MPKHHHAGPALCKGLRVGRKVGLGVPAAGDVRQPQMRILLRAALTGKMLERWDDAALRQPLPKGQSVRGHKRRIGAEAALQRANGRIGGVAVHIRHRGQINRNSQRGQFHAQLPGNGAGFLRAGRAHALGGRQIGKTALRLEPPHPSALLVNSYEHGAGGRRPQRGCEPPHLLGRNDIAFPACGNIPVKQDNMPHMPGAHLRKKGIALGQIRPAKAQHEHGADHDVQRWRGTARACLGGRGLRSQGP
ncbi:hypothetical protein DSECCO2_122680 [anaerobic digester metagenome]